MPRPAAEDLIQEVATADKAKRAARGNPPVTFKPNRRSALQSLYNAIGRLWGSLMFFFPWSVRKPYVQFIIRKMGGHAAEPNPELQPRIESTIRLARELERQTGQWPALLVATSHPETEGPLQWLRFEVMAQGVALANAVAEARDPGKWFYSHPRCMLAIDPFALDTVSAPVGGIYAGWMHQIYLAYDRQSSSQSWLQKHLLLKGSSYKTIAWKLFRLLRSDTPILLAYGGGLPYNARLLYGAREFVHRLQPPRWQVPKRAAQLEVIRILLKPVDHTWPAEQGMLPDATRTAVSEAFARWGVPAANVRETVDKFSEEFRRSVPLRERLLRALYVRLVKRGKPLIIIPITHNKKAPHVEIGEPISLTATGWDFSPIYKNLANIFDPSASKG